MSLSIVQSAPLVISLLAGLLISLTIWGLLRHNDGHEAGLAMGTYDAMLTGLFLLAVLALGIFLAYILIR